eukprot:COSAG02_NODE_4101_length_5775_cov_9.883721_3_plen_98_part_00
MEGKPIHADVMRGPLSKIGRPLHGFRNRGLEKGLARPGRSARVPGAANNAMAMGELQDFMIDQFAGAAALILGSVGGLTVNLRVTAAYYNPNPEPRL